MAWFLNQTEYEALMKLLKEFKEQDEIALDKRWAREILAPETEDSFILDYYHGKIEFKKFSINKRYRKSIVLVRYCSHGTHTNPDGDRFDGAHLHLFKEGFDDKIAVDVKTIGAKEDSSVVDVMEKFLKYCNVQKHPNIKATLF